LPASSAPGLSLSNLYEHAVEQWKRLPRVTPSGALAAGSIPGTAWKPVGPNSIVEVGLTSLTFVANGRVNSIAVDPTNSNRVYLGSAGGGVWRSDNGGDTWRPLTDQEISLGIGSSHALAIDPNHSNIIYAGTSNFGLLAQSRPRPIDRSQSRGILKSTDAGASWIVLGSGFPSGNTGNAPQMFRDRDITTLIIDPLDSNRLYAAAGRTAPGGVFRSTNAGLDWTIGNGSNGRAESLVLDTSSPLGARVLYAGLNGIGVLKSEDGGQSWSPVLGAAALPSGFNKVIVSLAPTATPPNPSGQVAYATVFDPSGQGFIFESTNGGTSGSWFPRNGQVVFSDPQFTTLAGSAFSDMVVDPASPGDGTNDLIYWGGFSQFLSTDSGNTFREIGQVNGTHGDHQTFLLVPRPGDSSVVYAGDDGGIWKSTDQGGTWTGNELSGLSTTINAGGLQTAILYALAVKQDATASVSLGGTQDNGIVRTEGGLTWTTTLGGDGMDVAFERVATNADVAYSIGNCGPADCLRKSTDGGKTFPTDLSPNVPGFERGLFQNRLAVDPSQAGYLYVGGSAGSVYQSTDGGSTFRSLGVVAPNAYITSLDVAPSNSNNVVVAAASNQVFVSTNAQASTVGLPSGVIFPEITRDLPNRFVTRVAFDPNDPNVVYATLAGFGATTPARPGHVFRTMIAGASSWTDISPLVDVPVNAIALDGTSVPAVLYVGTDLGVLRTVDGGANWAAVDDIHLPNAAVSALDVNLPAGVLRAATWGRGVFELAAPEGPVIFVGETGLKFEETCAGSGADRTIHVTNAGTQNLLISSVQRLTGSSRFTVLPSPATPLTIPPGGSAVFTVHYVPTVPEASDSAVIRVSSNDPNAPFVDLQVTGSLETTPPVISNLSAAPNVLQPPKHKMVPVTVSVTVTDNCDASVAQSCQIVQVQSNEPVSGTGEGDTAPDWQITGNLTVNLRAERAGSGTGRVYTIFVRCTDNAGQSGGTATIVSVPH